MKKGKKQTEAEVLSFLSDRLFDLNTIPSKSHVVHLIKTINPKVTMYEQMDWSAHVRFTFDQIGRSIKNKRILISEGVKSTLKLAGLWEIVKQKVDDERRKKDGKQAEHDLSTL